MDEEDNGSTGTLEDESSKSPSTTLRQGHHRTLLVSALILLLGTAAAAAFTLLGVTGAMRESSDQFSYRASELVTNVQNAWQAYETAGLYLHNAGSRGRAEDFDAPIRQACVYIAPFFVGVGYEFPIDRNFFREGQEELFQAEFDTFGLLRIG